MVAHTLFVIKHTLNIALGDYNNGCYKYVNRLL